MVIKRLPSPPPAIQGETQVQTKTHKTPAAKGKVTNDLSQLPNLVTPPPTKITTTIADQKPEGFVVEHAFDPKHNRINFTKVVTMHVDGTPRTILLHRPVAKFAIGATIGFEFGSHEGKPTAVNPYLVSDKSQVGDLIAYVTNDDVSANRDAKEIFIPHLVERYLASKEKDVALFLKAQGIAYIICVVENRVIYRADA